jgi:malonate-semialdehyde dehydrogenase (acetylating)/methylmalonate-semialdehyde dehydrogenase
MKYPIVQNFIGGRFVASTSEHAPVLSPLDGAQLSQVPHSASAEVSAAVQSAKDAFPAWSTLTVKQRAAIAYRYRELLLRHAGELAQTIHEENGKTLDEARAEIVRGAEVTEFACSLPQLAAGEVLEVSPGVECRVDRERPSVS